VRSRPIRFSGLGAALARCGLGAALARCGLGAALALPLLGAASAPPPPGRPTYVDYRLEAPEIGIRCRAEIGRAERAAAEIAALPSWRARFTTVILPLEDLSANLNDRLVAETLLASVSPSPAVRDASNACTNAVNDFEAALQARPDLYRAVAEAARRSKSRSPADRKLAALWLVALERSGAALSPAGRREFVRLSQRLGALETAFAANLANNKAALALAPSQTAGLPDDFVATFTKKGDDDVVPVNESTYARFMQDARDPEARKAFYYAYFNIAVPANVRLLRQAIAIRDRLAHLMGYRTWADYVLADRMARSPQRVERFLSALDAQLLPEARADVARLAALKAADSGSGDAAIEPWDVMYYDNRLRKTQYAVDDDQVRRYFPVDHVVRSVFDIYAKLLGVRFTPRVPANAWAPDVTQWAVSDAASGRYIGDFYLDLFPRPGKYSHFASFPLLPNRRLPNGRMRPPQDAIIGNWPEPAPGKPALLSHDEVRTFFHEFGHDMATILATTPYETLSSGFRQDFIEAPSQMLENWVWDPKILEQLSANVESGAPLPAALIEKIRQARYVDDALHTTTQIAYATIDMEYHTSGPKVDTTAVYAKVLGATTPLALPAGVHPEAGFGHLMGGYDAGYYGYLWSKVYAQDMFTAFVRAGLENPTVGARYRREILEPAREREPDDEIRAFLGRPMSPVPFYVEFQTVPSVPPSPAPSASPSPAPSASPTPAPSASPSPAPSASPSPAPSISPSQ
jgi:Zn-dependent oligopeptidase